MIPRALPAPKGKGLLTGLLASLGIGALAVGGGITRNPALLLAMVCTGAACMAMVLRGRPSLGAVLVFLCGAGFLKRALFAFGPVSREEYFLAILLPDVVLGVAGLAALRGWKGRVAPADGMVVLFFLFCASQVLNPHVSPSTGAAGFKLTGMSVVAYVLGRSTGRDPGEVDRLEEWILVIASVAAVAGIISFVSGPTGFERSWMLSGQTALTELHRQGGAGYRVMSFFESHEQLGFFLGLAIMVVASRDRMRPGARLALVVLFLTTLFLTYSRSSWIALGVGGGCILIHRLRGRGPVRLAIVLPAAGLIGAAVFGTWLASLSVGTDHPLLEKALQTGTFSARVEGWRQFWVDPRYGTLLGNGIGSLWAASTKFDSGVPVPHNGILQFLFELGWVGTVLFALACWMLARAVSAGNTPTGRAATGYFLGVLFANACVAELMQLRQIAVPFWLLAGVMVSRGPARTAPDPEAGSEERGIGGEVSPPQPPRVLPQSPRPFEA